MDNALEDPKIPWKGISELVERAGSCANKRDFLECLLNDLATLIPYGHGAGLYRADGLYSASRGIDLHTVLRFNDYYYDKIGFLPQPRMNALTFGSMRDLLPIKWLKYRHTEFVSDFCVPERLGSTLLFFTPGNVATLAVHRSLRESPFTDTDKTTLRILNGHVNNFLGLYGQLEESTYRMPDPGDIKNRFPALSAREIDVVRQTCLGFSAALIAKRAGLSRRTVETQLRSAYQKTGAAGKKDLVGMMGVSGQPESASVFDPHLVIF